MFRTILVFLMLLPALDAQAQARRPSHCIALSQSAPGLEYLQLAAYTDPIEAESVRLHYIAHSMFLIRTPGGLNAVTDFTGFIGNTPLIPDVVTMNHAHESHWTAYPDPAIRFPLKGWATDGVAAEHHLDLGEMLVRNVPTDIRSPFGGPAEKNGNSIFVFEVAGLCIGHLGHLHHEPDAAQYAALGRMDVVMAAVDGGMTLDLPTMIRVLNRLRASVVIPMHWFGRGTLESFLAGMTDSYDVVRTDAPSVDISLRTLPARPTVLVLEPEYLADP